MEKNKWRIQLFLFFVMQGHDLLMFSFTIGWRLKIIIIDDGDHHQRRSSLLSCWWFNLDHKMDPVQRTLLVWVTMMMMMIDIGKECVCECECMFSITRLPGKVFHRWDNLRARSRSWTYNWTIYNSMQFKLELKSKSIGWW